MLGPPGGLGPPPMGNPGSASEYDHQAGGTHPNGMLY